MDYAAVSQASKRFDRFAEKEKRIDKMKEKVEKELAKRKVKGLPL